MARSEALEKPRPRSRVFSVAQSQALPVSTAVLSEVLRVAPGLQFHHL